MIIPTWICIYGRHPGKSCVALHQLHRQGRVTATQAHRRFFAGDVGGNPTWLGNLIALPCLIRGKMAMMFDSCNEASLDVWI